SGRAGRRSSITWPITWRRSRRARVEGARPMSTETIPQLKSISGRVIRPDDVEYDKARASFYGGSDRRPAAIVRVADANDVSRVIALARETGTEFVVRS